MRILHAMQSNGFDAGEPPPPHHHQKKKKKQTLDTVLKTLLKTSHIKSTIQRFERDRKLIIIFFLLFGKGIKSGFPLLGVLVAPKKALFHVIALLGDLVITYGTNLV